MGRSITLQFWTPTDGHPINGRGTIDRVPLAVDELLEISAAREVAVSPDGACIAFCLSVVEGGREVTRVHVVVLDRDERELVAPVEGRRPAWSPDGGSLSYLDVDGAGTQRRLLSLADGSSRPLKPDDEELTPDDPGEGEEIHGPSRSPDGGALAFGLARPGEAGIGPTATIEIREAGGARRTLETGCAYATCPSWSPDGSRIAFVGTVQPRIGLGDPALRAWVVDATGGAAEPVGPEGVILEPVPVGPTWSPAGDALYFRLARAGAIDLVRLDLTSREETALVAGRQVVDFSISGDVLACTVTAPDDPGSVQILSAGGRRRLEASVGEWTRRRAGAMPVPVRDTFRRADARELDGWVTGIDPSLAPQRTLLSFHGGPHGFFGPGFQRGHFHRAVLASRGWVVLAVNSSGSGSYGAAFADSLRGGWGERDLPEHLAALDRLIVEGIADPTRLAVEGYSYGGYLAAWAIGNDDRFAAAVIGAPISDLESFERTSDIGNWYTPWHMKGGLPENVDRHRRLSPAGRAAAVTTPALILHGEADRRVPLAQGELLRDRLAAEGSAAVELVVYPGAGHLFYSSGAPSERLDFNQRVVDWLETNVDGGGERA
jgi:dipeptidyl aminopeptidase/acylaminoacyl peptidase